MIITMSLACFSWAADIYVDAGATAGGGGSSWTDAYMDLQEALPGIVDRVRRALEALV